MWYIFTQRTLLASNVFWIKQSRRCSPSMRRLRPSNTHLVMCFLSSYIYFLQTHQLNTEFSNSTTKLLLLHTLYLVFLYSTNITSNVVWIKQSHRCSASMRRLGPYKRHLYMLLLLLNILQSPLYLFLIYHHTCRSILYKHALKRTKIRYNYIYTLLT